MRIIAGLYRGRRLSPVKGIQTRPALEKVRGALFDMIEPDLPGASVLDLFAGTGSLGLEALSRGAQRVVFVEQSRTARQALSRNIEQLDAGDHCEVVARNAFRIQPEQLGVFDLVLADPPFVIADGPELRELQPRIVAHWLAADGLLVLRLPVGAEVCEPLDGMTRLRDRKYGDSRLLIDHRR